jgi:hypothetical protein
MVRIDNSGQAAVDVTYFWQPIRTCPRGVKVQLLGMGGVAMYGVITGEPDMFYTHWAPLPKRPKGDAACTQKQN